MVLFWPLVIKVNPVQGDSVMIFEKGKKTKQHLCVLGFGVGEYSHSWRIICRVCAFTVMQAQHLIRDWGLVASKYK